MNTHTHALSLSLTHNLHAYKLNGSAEANEMGDNWKGMSRIEFQLELLVWVFLLLKETSLLVVMLVLKQKQKLPIFLTKDTSCCFSVPLDTQSNNFLLMLGSKRERERETECQLCTAWTQMKKMCWFNKLHKKDRQTQKTHCLMSAPAKLEQKYLNGAENRTQDRSFSRRALDPYARKTAQHFALKLTSDCLGSELSWAL